MTKYNRVYLGKKSIYADECFAGGFIGVDFGLDFDLAPQLCDNLRTFNAWFVPTLQERFPDRTRVSASLNGGALWRICKEMTVGDIVLSPAENDPSEYMVGTITGEYQFAQGEFLPHRRTVSWSPQRLKRDAMSPDLQHSAGSIGTLSCLDKYAEELEVLLDPVKPNPIRSSDPTIENPTVFAMESHLEDFLVKNWEGTSLGQEFDIYTDEDGVLAGQQLQTDTGPLDILAVSKDKKRLLVVELKRGRASDHVAGQVLRYMGYVKDELAEPDQTIEGVIIGKEDDPKLQRALSMMPNVRFMRYRVSFKLE